MNKNQNNAAAQSIARQQGPTRRPAAEAAGYTTYEGGDFRGARSAHEPHAERAARDARAHDVVGSRDSRGARPERGARATQAVEGRDFRIPRGENTSQASAETREILEVREAHSRQGRTSRRSGNSGNHGGSGGRNGNDRGSKGSKGGKRKIAIAVIVVLLILAGFAAWKVTNLTPDEATGGAFYDQSASQIQEAVDHEVEDGYFNMSINTSVPVFEDNSAAIGIKNIESNSYDCMVTVTLDDGTEVYKSGGLAPGTELDMVTLTQTLEPGDYEATAVFDIYEQDEEHTVAGQTASKLTLHVL